MKARPPGQDVTIGRYLTSDDIRLALCGLATGSVVGLAWRMAGRVRWGLVPFAVAVLAAARVGGRSDWLQWDAMVASGAIVAMLAGAGAARLLADPAAGWEWVAAGSVFSAAGVWAGVPETGPALLVGGSLAGLAATSLLTRARWAPSAGVGVAAVLGWAALSGSASRPWAAVGGALCSGLAPWFALRPLFPTLFRSSAPHPWLLGAHLVLVILAARWIGVVPHAGWHRVAVVAAAGLAVVAAPRSRA